MEQVEVSAPTTARGDGAETAVTKWKYDAVAREIYHNQQPNLSDQLIQHEMQPKLAMSGVRVISAIESSAVTHCSLYFHLPSLYRKQVAVIV